MALIASRQLEAPNQFVVDQPVPNVDASARVNESVTPEPPAAAATTAVWAELAGRLGPAVLLAVTWSRSVKPTSAVTGT